MGVIGGCGKTICQSALRIPPEIVSTDWPLAVTRPTPTISNCPVVGLTDQISNSDPGGSSSVLGKVIGTGVANSRPAGCMVINNPGSRTSGMAAGAKSRGTSLIDIWPVNCEPSGFLAVFAGTSSAIPKLLLITVAGATGTTWVKLLASSRGIKNGRSSIFSTLGIRINRSLNEA